MRPRSATTQKTCDWKPRPRNCALTKARSCPIEQLWIHFIGGGISSMPFGFESCRFVPALRSLVHTCHEIFSPKMRVALEHLHGLVTANSGYLLVRKSGLHETA